MDRHSEETTVLSFRVPTEQATWVRDKAEKAGMTVNKALRLWLNEAYEKEA